MDFVIDSLNKNILFNNIPKEKLLCILNSSACYVKSFNPQVNIYKIGDEINYTGVILEGSVDIIQVSINGNETIVDRLTNGDIFGHSFSCVSDINYLNYVRSSTTSKILFINIYKLLQECDSIAEYRLSIFENIITSLTKNNLMLNEKIQIMSQKTLSDKLLTYFELLSIKNQSNEIVIPFNREQLACYLGSERSSVCRELSKLNDNNIISIKGKHVKLLSQSASSF